MIHLFKPLPTAEQIQIKAEKLRLISDPVGGYKMAVLNRTKSGEKRFNVVRTDGFCFSTDSKEEFINFLKERL